MMVVCILLLVATEVLTYFFGMIPGRFIEAISSLNVDQFIDTLWKTALFTMAKAVLYGILKLFLGIFQYKSREILTSTLQRSLLRSNQLHDIIYGHSKIDNPDQRISQDVDKFTECLIQIFQSAFLAPFLFAYYMWRVVEEVGYVGPLLSLGFIILSTAIVKFAMTPLVSLIFQKERLEGNFRFLHVMVRRNAEAILFSRGEGTELRNLEKSLCSLIETQRFAAYAAAVLGFLQTFFVYAATIVSYGVVGVTIINNPKYTHMEASKLAAITSNV